jgi:hypothetical protein
MRKERMNEEESEAMEKREKEYYYKLANIISTPQYGTGGIGE